MSWSFSDIAGEITDGIFGLVNTGINAYANHREADLSREWQERMAKNAYQYRVADLKAAGLNPILATGQNVSVPSGATATGNPSNIRTNFSGISSSSRRREKDLATTQIANLEAQTRAATTQAESNVAVAMKAKADAALATAEQKRVEVQSRWDALNYTNAANYWQRLKPQERAKAFMFMNAPSSVIGATGLTAVELASDIVNATNSFNVPRKNTTNRPAVNSRPPNREPAIVFPDGSTLLNPSPAARKALDEVKKKHRK